jgi:hypothetical protein
MGLVVARSVSDTCVHDPAPGMVRHRVTGWPQMWPNRHGETTAYTPSGSPARASTWWPPPGGACLVHVTPPSVVCQNEGQNAHPLSASAKRTSVTPVAFSRVRGAPRVPRVLHIDPPSVVPMAVVHVLCPHGADPRVQPWSGESQDMDWALKPAGKADGRAGGEPAPSATDPEAAAVTSAARHIDVASRNGERRTSHLRGSTSIGRFTRGMNPRRPRNV